MTSPPDSPTPPLCLIRGPPGRATTARLTYRRLPSIPACEPVQQQRWENPDGEDPCQYQDGIHERPEVAELRRGMNPITSAATDDAVPTRHSRPSAGAR